MVEGRENLEDFIRLDKAKHPEQYAKWGIINEEGEEVLPVEYDDIWNFLGKNRFSTKVVKDGESHEVYFHDLNPSLPVRVVAMKIITAMAIGEMTIGEMTMV